MKKHILEFIHRGMAACCLDPIVLVVIYLILKHRAAVQTRKVSEVSIGIFSLTTLAFVTGGLNFLYQIEKLPLMVAILIHGCVLYASYLATYMVNGWLDWGMAPILVFTGIFVVGYFEIWGIIYFIIKKNTDKVNEILKKNRKWTSLDFCDIT